MQPYREAPDMADLAVVIVSANSAKWLEPCLSTVFARMGDATIEVMVVDNASTDGTRELVESRFPCARVISSPNYGFAYGNNRGLEQVDARYVLLLNPDTEVTDGTFGELIELLDVRPEIGAVGVRQLKPDGTLCHTMHRFPGVSRAFGEALASERWPVHPAWAGEREYNPHVYEREAQCDWPTGSFLLIRREALMSAGLLDERFFLYSEETDLCLRIKRAGWQVWHLPQMTIIHHAGKQGTQPRILAQDVYARKQYARKHFSRPYRSLYLAALAARYVLRIVGARTGRDDDSARREGARRALLALAGRAEPPFRDPPGTALDPRVCTPRERLLR
jgi:N-acetylglucosaminyl-diphospho-decaprenol L-rhamnosyltransferase